MTAGEIIDAVDRTKPNSFGRDEKLAWLDEVEGRVAIEVMLMDPVNVLDLRLTETRTPIVRPPHDRIYPAYLSAQIDFANGDYDRYQATAAMFNSLFGDFMRWFAQTWEPANGYWEGST